ncbi:unnamed protein product [Blepharisma stoltei]|uniref:Uncharacterized protein n=1 Tax=Blepharisma stoltei TaxID=1481888 RepID=A0AAU9IEA6_9CILI|nr:unnamed protein product [Blepharisma stoltei]
MQRSNKNVVSTKQIAYQSHISKSLPIPFITNQFGKHQIWFEKILDHKTYINQFSPKSVSHSRSNSNIALTNRSMSRLTSCSTPWYNHNSYTQRGNYSVFKPFQGSQIPLHRKAKSMGEDMVQQLSVSFRR